MNKTLQELIKEKNIKQKDIAEKLGMHESTVSLKISGNRELSLEEACVLAEMLNVDAKAIRQAINFAKCKNSN